jgi:hypothetical protein
MSNLSLAFSFVLALAFLVGAIYVGGYLMMVTATLLLLLLLLVFS